MYRQIYVMTQREWLYWRNLWSWLEVTLHSFYTYMLTLDYLHCKCNLLYCILHYLNDYLYTGDSVHLQSFAVYLLCVHLCAKNGDDWFPAEGGFWINCWSKPHILLWAGRTRKFNSLWHYLLDFLSSPIYKNAITWLNCRLTFQERSMVI